MVKRKTQLKKIKRYSILFVGSLVGLLTTTPSNKVEGAGLGGPTHIGTFEGSTTFTTSSSNGVNPGLFLEVMDEYGNLTQYESEEGIITVPNTQEGAYVTQAKLLGKTKYRVQDTGELLEEWEEGRNLELVSVENPELKTVGKNLFDLKKANKEWGGATVSTTGGNTITFAPNSNNSGSLNATFELANDRILKAGTKLTYSQLCVSEGSYDFTGSINNSLELIYGDGTTETVFLPDITSRSYNRVLSTTFVLSKDCVGIKTHPIMYAINNLTNPMIVSYQLEVSDVATTHEQPNQSNILSTPSDLELCGIGDVQDTLNLLTGELNQRIDEVVLNDTKTGITMRTETLENTILLVSHLSDIEISSNLIYSDKFDGTVIDWNEIITSDKEFIRLYINDNNALYIRILKSKLETEDVDGFRKWLTKNPLTIKYQRLNVANKTVFLDSTYYFQPVMNRDVYVDGTILPLVCSVTIPTESLAFVLNPNAEAGQQFIAPEFTVVNHTPTSIYLELKRFEQLTTVMNDVLPEAHEDWSQLNREQSKDIALALVPKPSEGWLNLEEGPRYVADDSNYYLGEVKAESSVDFTFIASHGRAFVEPIDPKYRLSFVFDFFE